MSPSVLSYAAACGLAVILALAAATWLVSVAKRDVSIVDSMWSVLIAGAAISYVVALPTPGPRTPWLIALVLAWAARLAFYVAWRGWGEPEDRRYQAIRARNQPAFALKSVYLVFGLQGVLAWIVSAPLLAALASARAVGVLDGSGIVLAAAGIVIESVADVQLARFTARPESAGRVLDTGLWRYSRHPNYFGEFCVWWGLYLVALAADGAWAIVSPLLMSVLLLKVSGVTLLEKDIGERRPAYRDYIARTPAFFPWPRRNT